MMWIATMLLNCAKLNHQNPNECLGNECDLNLLPMAILIQNSWIWLCFVPTSSGTAPQSSVNLITTHVLRADAWEDDTISLDKEVQSDKILGHLWEREDTLQQHRDFSKGASMKYYSNGKIFTTCSLTTCSSARGDYGFLHRLKQTPEILLASYNSIMTSSMTRSRSECAYFRVHKYSPVHYLPHQASCSYLQWQGIFYDASARSIVEQLHVYRTKVQPA